MIQNPFVFLGHWMLYHVTPILELEGGTRLVGETNCQARTENIACPNKSFGGELTLDNHVNVESRSSHFDTYIEPRVRSFHQITMDDYVSTSRIALHWLHITFLFFL